MFCGLVFVYKQLIDILMSVPLKSKYYLELSEELHKSYDEKIDLLGGVDPYFRIDAKSTVG